MQGLATFAGLALIRPSQDVTFLRAQAQGMSLKIPRIVTYGANSNCSCYYGNSTYHHHITQKFDEFRFSACKAWQSIHTIKTPNHKQECTLIELPWFMHALGITLLAVLASTGCIASLIPTSLFAKFPWKPNHFGSSSSPVALYFSSPSLPCQYFPPQVSPVIRDTVIRSSLLPSPVITICFANAIPTSELIKYC